MADFLPDEIWMIILGYVPFEDRLDNVSFVSKRLHRLCSDHSLCQKISFANYVFQDQKCLERIHRLKSQLIDISFSGCHWFREELFDNLPVLPNLKVLNLSSCALSIPIICKIFLKTPSLEKLCLPLDYGFIATPSCKSMCKVVFQLLPKLRWLHIEVLACFLVHEHLLRKLLDIVTIVQEHYEEFDFLSYSWDKNMCCMYAFDKIPDLSSYTWDQGYAIRSVNNLPEYHIHSLQYCDDFASLCDAPCKNNETSLFDIKFLALQCCNSYLNCEYFEGDTCMPNLQCLILGDITSGMRDYNKAYHDFAYGILTNLNLPNLRCLALTDEHTNDHPSNCNGMPEIFYHRLGLLKHLDELDLGSLHLDFMLLLDRCNKLKLKALSFKLLFCHSHKNGPNENSSWYDFFAKLVNVFPYLEKLRVAVGFNFDKKFLNLEMMMPLRGLKCLKELSIIGRVLPACHSFEELFSQCSQLLSLCLETMQLSSKTVFHQGIKQIAPHLVNLKELRLIARHTDLCVDCMEALLSFNNLETLMVEFYHHLVDDLTFLEYLIKLFWKYTKLHTLVFLLSNQMKILIEIYTRLSKF